jgi:biopolymer transport protein ExbB
VFLNAAVREARLSGDVPYKTGIKERASSSFTEISRAEARRIRMGMGLLATIGATSPFVGLFGTVWGIMNSFIGISKSQTTNLAVVAPGIAEALLATAIGLVAAIPAVIIYNHFSRVTKGYLELVGRASGAAGRLLSRDRDRARGPMIQAAE